LLIFSLSILVRVRCLAAVRAASPGDWSVVSDLVLCGPVSFIPHLEFFLDLFVLLGLARLLLHWSPFPAPSPRVAFFVPLVCQGLARFFFSFCSKFRFPLLRSTPISAAGVFCPSLSA
jgi:hypothetical protein